MKPNLEQQIEQAALEFANQVIAALRNLSLNELAEMTSAHAAAPRSYSRSTKVTKAKAGPTGRVRRSNADIAAMQKQIVSLVSKAAKGLRAEQIRKQLGVEKKHIAEPIKQALAAKALTKKGEKRATTYFAAK